MPRAEPVELSDAVLLAATGEGDERAFEAFVARHEGWLFAHARAIGGPGAAEELLQDAFVAAWRSAKTFHGGDVGARPWLSAIVRNAFRRRFRHRVGEPATHEPIESVDAMAVHAGWGSDGGDAFEQLATREAVERALAALDVEEREVVVLRDLEGWTGEETARALGLSLAAVKSRLHRARLRMLAALREPNRG